MATENIASSITEMKVGASETAENSENSAESATMINGNILVYSGISSAP